MKKLSEIGREVVELSDMEFVDPDTVDWGDAPETQKFTVISDAERRELVREGIKTFIIENTKDWELKAKLGECLDKFLEENGL